MKIKTKTDVFIDAVIYLLMLGVVIITLYPLWYILVASLSSGEAVAAGKVVFWVRNFTFDSYNVVFKMKNIWTAYANTVFYSIAGTLLNMVLTVLGAYALSKQRLRGRKIFTIFVMITMWFSPGMIAYYINYRDLNLLDNRLGILLCGAISTYYVILMRSFFESVPKSLEESAQIDGANDFVVLLKIYLPLSTAALLTISLYYFVEHWNSYFWPMILLTDERKIPLQVMLKKLIVQMSGMESEKANMDYTVMSRETVVYANMIVAVVPMLFVYPFVQKYFIKGVMIGAVKE